MPLPPRGLGSRDDAGARTARTPARIPAGQVGQPLTCVTLTPLTGTAISVVLRADQVSLDAEPSIAQASVTVPVAANVCSSWVLTLRPAS